MARPSSVIRRAENLDQTLILKHPLNQPPIRSPDAGRILRGVASKELLVEQPTGPTSGQPGKD